MSLTELNVSRQLTGVSLSRPAARTAHVSASESVQLFVIRSLLHPVVSVLMLSLWVATLASPPYGHYVVVGVLSFLGAGELFDLVPSKFAMTRLMALRLLIDIVIRWMALVAFVVALLKLSRLMHPADAKPLLYWGTTTPLVLWIGELLAQRHLRGGHPRSGSERQAVIIGATKVGLELERNLDSRSVARVGVLGFFDDRNPGRLPEECRDYLLGGLREVGAYVASAGIDIVYITLPMVPHARITDLLSSLRDSTASVYFVPDLRVFEAVQPRFDLIDGIPVIAVCESPYYGLHTVAKRLSDVIIAGTAILLLAPLFIAVALAVRLSSPGDVIYRQRRYGLDGREITIFKFRSLRVIEDGHASYTQVARDDARLTRVGAFIRKTSLDELPQLFNVLVGNMSIVGPRPHAIAVNEQYRRLIPGYMMRHKVKPGITGWAQVNGFRGGDDLSSMTMRITYDIEYLRHWSLGLDFIIMFKTALMVLNDRRAY